MSEKTFQERIQETLTGATQQNALAFAAYLDKEGMTVSGGEISYNGYPLCYIHIDGKPEIPGPWTIWSPDGFTATHPNVPMSDDLIKIAHAHANVCGKCGAPCAPGSRKTIFGKEFDNICSSDMMFTDPDAATLECVKKLLEIKKQDAPED